MEGVIEFLFFVGIIYWLYPNFFTKGLSRFVYIFYNYIEIGYVHCILYSL